jgi:hypothetical protein
LGLLAFLAIAVIALPGCAGGPPDALNDRYKALPDRIESAEARLAEAKKDHAKLLGGNSYTFITNYTAAEQHLDGFDKAKASLDEAKLASKKAERTVDEYEDAKLADLEKTVNEAEQAIKDAKALEDEPAQWAKEVLKTKENPAKTVSTAEAEIKSVLSGYPLLVEESENVIAQFPQQKQRIAKLIAPFTELHDKMVSALESLQAEAAKPKPNYAQMTEHAQVVVGGKGTFVEDDKAVRAKFKELPTTETHTLVDIRVDTVVFISRTSWDSWSDYGGDTDFDYPDIAVDQEAAEYFSGLAIDQQLAHDVDAKLLEGIDAAQWAKLDIDPSAGMPGGDNSAEWYYGGMEDSICHQVLVLIDGEPDASGHPSPEDDDCAQYNTEAALAEGKFWVEPDDGPLFEAIGMDIFSKGAGLFRDEATTAASPPGMAYVGDPKTGEWKEDSDGNSFWVFYGKYRLFSDLIGGPRPYHYRSEYNTWNNGPRYNNKPYYAGTAGNPRYGGKSAGVNSRLPKGSSYKSTGLSSANARGAGPSARAGGPGGGGK